MKSISDPKKCQLSSDIPDREPPRAQHTEAAVLGAVFVDPSIMSRLTTLLNENDFFDPFHRKIWAAMCWLHRRGLNCDASTTIDALKMTTDLSHGEQSELIAYFVARVFRLHPSVILVDDYVALMREAARRRHAVKRGSQLIEAAHRADFGSSLPEAAARRAKRRRTV